jgi:uncharacterized protein
LSKINVLVFSGGEIHDGKGVGDRIEAILKRDDRLAVSRVHEDLSVLESPKLDAYDVLVFFYTIGEISLAQREGLLSWVAKGHGFVPVHSGADSFRGCPEYRAMVGGWFVTHPAYRQYQVSVTDQTHPITEGIDEFFVTDEMYVTDYDPRVQVLANSLWHGQVNPVAWTNTWGEAGRIFYLALGHDPKACECDIFATLLTRGTVWAATPAE